MSEFQFGHLVTALEHMEPFDMRFAGHSLHPIIRVDPVPAAAERHGFGTASHSFSQDACAAPRCPRRPCLEMVQAGASVTAVPGTLRATRDGRVLRKADRRVFWARVRSQHLKVIRSASSSAVSHGRCEERRAGGLRLASLGLRVQGIRWRACLHGRRHIFE